MSKQILTGNTAREQAVDALINISNIVSATAGPGGRPILLSRNTSALTNTMFHTKDGITVLRELNYTTPIYDAVHKLCLQASSDTMINCGDGTTSTLIMAAAFAKTFHNSPERNPQMAIRKYRKEVLKTIEEIQKEAVFSDAAERNVALTSTNGDVELTEVVLNALAETSAYGTVLVEKSISCTERFKVDKEFGYQAGNGYGYNISFGISVSDIATTNGDFYLDDCFVIPYNGNIGQFSQIFPMIQKFGVLVGKQQVNLMFVAYEINEDVLNNLIELNRKNPSLKVFVTKTTPTAEVNGQWNQLNDVAAFSGADIVDAGSVPGWNIPNAGLVKKVRVGVYKTFLIGKNDAKNWIAKRAMQNEESANLAPTPLDKEIISSRNASLTGGLVKITVGGGLISDLEEIAARADDAIRSVQACRRSGALPGCGISYIRAGMLANVSKTLMEALYSVTEKIQENYGLTYTKDEINEVATTAGTTYAIQDDIIQTGDFLKLSVADSYETIRSVLLNGFQLGALVANLGGFCVTADLEEIQKSKLLKDVMLG